MARKIYCDGCDEEIRFPDEDNNVRIVIGENSTQYDLCDTCVSNHMTPKKWPRYAKESHIR